MTNDQGNPGQNSWPQQPAGQQPYPQQQPWPRQPAGQQQPYPQQQPGPSPYGQQPAGSSPYGGQPSPQQQPFGGPYGGATAGQRPRRSFREPLVGAIGVVAVAVVLVILGVMSTLTYDLDVGYVADRLVSVFIPIAFAAAVFVGSAFISPIDKATTRAGFLRSALIAGALGAVVLFAVNTVFALLNSDDFMGSFVRYAVVGTLSQSIQYLAVFIAAILLDRLGRGRTS